MKGCLRPWRNLAKTKHIVWLEKRLRKFWSLETPAEIKMVGELWGHGQIQIQLEDGEWRGRIRKCEFARNQEEKIIVRNNAVTVKVVLYWFAHKKVTVRQDKHSIDRTNSTWDRILHPYEVNLTLLKVQQTKTKPKRLYFETSGGESGYFALRNDQENVFWKRGNVREPEPFLK